MFENATAFNQDISSWNTGAVTSMSHMFKLASVFNQNINSWDTSKVTTMKEMFRGANSFNQDISSWNTGAVEDMSYMFNQTSVFNNGGRPLAWSDTSKVTDMSHMFNNAIAFNQDISSWNAAPTTCGKYFAKGATAWLAAYPPGVGGSIASSPPLNAAMAAICGP